MTKNLGLRFGGLVVSGLLLGGGASLISMAEAEDQPDLKLEETVAPSWTSESKSIGISAGEGSAGEGSEVGSPEAELTDESSEVVVGEPGEETVTLAEEDKAAALSLGELFKENKFLKSELEEVSTKLGKLEGEIKGLLETRNVDPYKAALFPIETPMGLKLTQVHFDSGSAKLSPGAERRVLAAAAWISKEGLENVTLVGLSDSAGDAASNKELSKARVSGVADLLAAHGIKRDVIKLQARGEEAQVEVTEDGVSEPLNRCVAIFVRDSKTETKTSAR